MPLFFLLVLLLRSLPSVNFSSLLVLITTFYVVFGIVVTLALRWLMMTTCQQACTAVINLS